VTDGILLAHRQGIVTSATLAANMPDAERAAHHVASLPSLKVGVHLNACQGRPLSEKSHVLVGDDGVMNHTGPGLVASCLLKPGRVAAALGEFEAQIQWVLDHGIRPTHLDSHRHVHAFPPLFAGVVRLAVRYGIPCVRWPRERLCGSGWPRPARKQARAAGILRAICALDAAVCRRVRATTGTWGIAHTGHITPQWLIRAAESLPEGATEIMVHPGLPEDLDAKGTRLLESRRIEMEALCDPAVKEAFDRNQVELIDYGRLYPTHA
jgi:predicted glycoside hydrolase/deacetylase ChbG (UPF0249 family)